MTGVEMDQPQNVSSPQLMKARILMEAAGSSDYSAMDPLENLDRVADYVAWPLTTTSLFFMG